MRDLLTVTFIKASSQREKHMEKGYISGATEKFMMESGYMELNKDMACGKAQTVNLILVNGRVAKLMVMACMFGSMETDMKESGSNA